MKQALADGCQEKCLEELVSLFQYMQEAIFDWHFKYSEWASVLFLSSYFAATQAFPPILLARYAPSSIRCRVCEDDGTVRLILNLWNEDVEYILPRDTNMESGSPEVEFYNAVMKLRREEGTSSPRADAGQGALLLLCMLGKDGSLASRAVDPYETHPAKLLAAGMFKEAREAASEFSYLYIVYFASILGHIRDVNRVYRRYVEAYCPEYMCRVLFEGEDASLGARCSRCSRCSRISLELQSGYCCMICADGNLEDEFCTIEE